MTKQLFSEGLLKMAGITLEEEPRKILEPRRIEGREEKQIQEELLKINQYLKTATETSVLDLTYSPITKFPENIHNVPGSLLLGMSKVEHLPSPFKVKKLVLTACPIKELPSGLEVEVLYIDNTSITKLPADLKVSKAIHLYRTPLAQSYESIKDPTERVKSLYKAFPTLSNTEEIYLYDTYFPSEEEDWGW